MADTERARCALCGTERAIFELDDAMVCVRDCQGQGIVPASYEVTVREECSPPDCTLTREEHEGEGHEFGNPCSNGCIHEDGHDTDYSEPHEWFQYAQDVQEGNPSCSGCQLPYENARHRGRYVATITIHGNDRDLITEEADNLVRYFHEGDTSSDLWLDVDRTWE